MVTPVNFDVPKAYREMAAGGAQFRGLTLLNYVDQISGLLRIYGCVDMLDYGCGAGDGYREPHRLAEKLGVVATLYDPSFPEFDKLPDGSFDAVICSDVLEHIYEDEVDNFIATLFSYADKLVWASVCCRPAKKNFYGTQINLHLTIRPIEWWAAKFTEHAPAGVAWDLVEAP
jgi:hypothetical protein